jgi:hypothetical protein
VILGVAALGCLASGSAAASEIEVRGTLLCRPQGDPRRERPLDSACVIVEPVGRPAAAQVLDEAGFFRIRITERDLDRMLVLRVHHGGTTVDLIRTYLDSRRLRGDLDRYVLDARVIPGDCESFSCSPGEALAVQDSLRAVLARTSPPRDEESRWYSKPGWSWLAATLPAALLAGAAGGGDEPPGETCPGDSLVSTSVETLDVTGTSTSTLGPGDWPAFAREASSPALGRSITSWQADGELALWNPSALALGRGHGASIGFGAPLEARGAAWAVGRVPVARGARLPLAVAVAYAERGADRDVDARLSDGSVLRRETDHRESLLTLGLGVSPRPAFALGATLRRHSVRFEELESVERTTRTCVTADSRIYDRVTNRVSWREHDSSEIGFDVGATWDPSPAHRVAAVALDAGGGSDRRTAVLGYELYAGRLRAGLETSVRDREAEIAGGLSLRVADSLSLDAGAGSRFETLQAGVDARKGRFTMRLRVRSDEYESGSYGAGLAFVF